MHGDNDLVWIGRAANHAAKLCAVKPMSIWITKAIYSGVAADAKFAGEVDMWSPYQWTAMNNEAIYGSNYYWEPK